MAKADPQGGEFGTAAYDATIHPANAAVQSILAGRVEAARNVHLFGDRSAAASVFSHVYEASPNPTAIHFMGLAQHRDLIERQVQRVNDQPFPGVALGHTPGFHAAPNTNPLAGPIGPVGHHSHRVESKRRTRYRFGR